MFWNLYIKIRSVDNSFSTNIYWKVTFSRNFTNFENFIAVSYMSENVLSSVDFTTNEERQVKNGVQCFTHVLIYFHPGLGC